MYINKISHRDAKLCIQRGPNENKLIMILRLTTIIDYVNLKIEHQGRFISTMGHDEQYTLSLNNHLKCQSSIHIKLQCQFDFPFL